MHKTKSEPKGKPTYYQAYEGTILLWTHTEDPMCGGDIETVQLDTADFHMLTAIIGRVDAANHNDVVGNAVVVEYIAEKLGLNTDGLIELLATRKNTKSP